MPTTAIKPARRQPPKTTVRHKAKRTGKRIADPRRETKTQAQFKRWMAANAQEIGKWARSNTKLLTGREMI